MWQVVNGRFATVIDASVKLLTSKPPIIVDHLYDVESGDDNDMPSNCLWTHVVFYMAMDLLTNILQQSLIVN